MLDFSEHLASSGIITRNVVAYPRYDEYRPGGTIYSFQLSNSTFAKSQSRGAGSDSISFVMGKARLVQITGIKQAGTGAVAEALITFDPTPIFEMFRSNYATELLGAAVAHFNLFGTLAGGARTLAALGQSLGLARRPMIVLTTALRAMGLLRLDGAGRVVDGSDLTVPGHQEIQVIGDLAAFEQEGHLVPGIAPAAIQEGRHAAANIVRAVGGLPLLPFRYRDKGTLATIGRAAAGADLGRIRLTGLIAGLAWLVVHLVRVHI